MATQIVVEINIKEVQVKDGVKAASVRDILRIAASSEGEGTNGKQKAITKAIAFLTVERGPWTIDVSD